ncbi:hypothetical protein F4775DRAFT_569124 [Biscogniauxia sp. FL1348]|nr:hypothetical protein F4775DRAFT_569124 [Biscogniauxia sp. FL1348]
MCVCTYLTASVLVVGARYNRISQARGSRCPFIRSSSDSTEKECLLPSQRNHFSGSLFSNADISSSSSTRNSCPLTE